MVNRLETAVLGGGCFWCLDAIYHRVKGVVSVTTGYAGGHISNPRYDEVSTGHTGHAEVVRIEFNPEKITYQELLEIFWGIHDPTTKDRQGNDIGSQYRSVLLYQSEQQRSQVQKSLTQAQKLWDQP